MKIWIKKERVIGNWVFPTQYLCANEEQVNAGELDKFLMLGWEITEDIPWYLA